MRGLTIDYKIKEMVPPMESLGRRVSEEGRLSEGRARLDESQGAGLPRAIQGREQCRKCATAAGLIVDDRESGIFRVIAAPSLIRIFRARTKPIFDRSWLFAGHASEFPDPGDFITRTAWQAAAHPRA